MNNVRFAVNGTTLSYGNFYKAFGLSITAADLLGAVVACTLGSMARRGTPGVRTIGWAMVVWQIAGMVLSVMFIATRPAILSAVAAACLALGALLTRRVKERVEVAGEVTYK
jgi:Na+/H+-dicarboxylate symporter